MSKREKTKYPNIFKYETKSGTRYQVRKKFGDASNPEINESGFKTIAKAKVRLAEIEVLTEKNEEGFIFNNGVTVNEYYNKYAKMKVSSKAWTPDSEYGNSSLFKVHILPKYGDTKLIDLNRINYQNWINEKLIHLARESVKTIHVTFMALVNDACYTGTLERNRLQRISIGESLIKPRSKDVSLENYKKWMSCAEKTLSGYHFSMIYLTTFGLRRGEVMGMTKRFVNIEDSLLNIIVSRTVRSPNGKSTKTESSKRLIPIDEKAVSLLNLAIKEAADIRSDFGHILHQDDFIFLNPVTNKPYSVSFLNRLFEKVSDECRIKINPHAMRHNFATQASLAGIAPRDYSRYLGHSNTLTTEGYTHSTIEQGKNVIEMFRKRVN